MYRWWDCIALPADVDGSDEASFRMQIKELALTVILGSDVTCLRFPPSLQSAEVSIVCQLQLHRSSFFTCHQSSVELVKLSLLGLCKWTLLLDQKRVYFSSILAEIDERVATLLFYKIQKKKTLLFYDLPSIFGLLKDQLQAGRTFSPNRYLHGKNKLVFSSRT